MSCRSFGLKSWACTKLNEKLGATETRAMRNEPYGLIANFADLDGNLFDLCAYVSGD